MGLHKYPAIQSHLQSATLSKNIVIQLMYLPSRVRQLIYGGGSVNTLISCIVLCSHISCIATHNIYPSSFVEDGSPFSSLTMASASSNFMPHPPTKIPDSTPASGSTHAGVVSSADDSKQMTDSMVANRSAVTFMMKE